MEIGELLVLIILLVFAAFFAGAETALTTFKRTKLKSAENENPKIVEYLKHWLKRPNEILVTLLLGTNIVITLAASIATVITDRVLQKSGVANENYAIIISTISVTVILLIFGEITPKIIARNNSEKFSKAVIMPVYYMSIIAGPVVWIFSSISIIISKMLGIKTKKDNYLITEEDIRNFVEVGEEEGVIEEEEKKMIHSIFDFGETLAKDVMIPRTNVFSIEASSKLSDVWDEILKNGYSRVPVYEEEIDNIIGIAYLKDLITPSRKKETMNAPIKKFVREAYFVPETKFAFEILKEFREKKIHLAIVIDEYGGTLGIITIEDLLEEIVGEINDEYDEEDIKIKKINDREYIINPIIDIETLNANINKTLPESDEYDTLSGFIYFSLGKIPELGAVVEYDNCRFIVTKLEKNRIAEVVLKENIITEEFKEDNE